MLSWTEVCVWKQEVSLGIAGNGAVFMYYVHFCRIVTLGMCFWVYHVLCYTCAIPHTLKGFGDVTGKIWVYLLQQFELFFVSISNYSLFSNVMQHCVISLMKLLLYVRNRNLNHLEGQIPVEVHKNLI